jgi:hypothetical protein
MEVDRLPKGKERTILKKLLEICSTGAKWSVEAAVSVACVLGDHADLLETAGRLEEAEAMLTLARSLAPERADLALRSARVARLSGDRGGALTRYREAAALAGGVGPIARLAGVGEGVVSKDPYRALTLAIRQALEESATEAAAVGLEERANYLRGQGERAAATHDLRCAAARFTDPVDLGRVAHALADLFAADHDPVATREALLFAVSRGDRRQREHAQARLQNVSRDVGDELGMRRWRPSHTPTLVSHGPASVGRSAQPVVATAPASEWHSATLPPVPLAAIWRSGERGLPI